jgi:nucleoside 2-deoxyribosyltransferase
MKIYFTGSITGGRELQPIYKEIVELLIKHGQCLTEHVASAEITSTGEDIDPVQIFERDVAWVKEADVLVAEVTNPSLGAGYEIALAESLGKPILCLFNTSLSRTLSGMIRGNKYLSMKNYSDPKELAEIIDGFFAEIDVKSLLS